MNATRLLAAAILLTRTATAGEILFYAGSYTDGGSSSKGITLLKMNTETGALAVERTAAELGSPSFLVLNADGSRLYAVSESGNSAAAYKVDRINGALAKLNELPVGDKPGQGACHLCLVPAAKMLVTANYGGGSVSTFSLAEDGRLAARTGFIQHTGSSANRGRQKEPHAHSAVLSPDGKYVLVNDLGTDRIQVYAVDAAGHTLHATPASAGMTKPGAGPRHGVFDAAGAVYFSINEIDSTITPFRWDAKAATLTPGTSVSTLPATFNGPNTTAEIGMHPSGKFLYGSNRGANNIAVFKTAGDSLTLVEHEPSGGKTPRNFNLTPDGKWLLAAHQDSDSIVVFAVNQADGSLSATGQTATVGKPVCIVFLPGTK